jgi:hypothetical protein
LNRYKVGILNFFHQCLLCLLHSYSPVINFELFLRCFLTQ